LTTARRIPWGFAALSYFAWICAALRGFWEVLPDAYSLPIVR
jgi:hypothetical protein